MVWYRGVKTEPYYVSGCFFIVREARLKEIKSEILNSEKLKVR